MKKSIFTIAITLLVASFTTNTYAQTSAEVTGTAAGARLIKPMTLTKTSDLHFGTINVLAEAGGTVVLPSNSITRVFSAGVAVSTINPQPKNGAFSVTGTKNSTYALTLPGTIIVKEEDDNTKTMTISALKARFNGAGTDATTSTLSASGTDSFTLGGTLTVAAAQITGIYAGTFDVSVDYN